MVRALFGYDLSQVDGVGRFGDPTLIWRHIVLEGNFRKEFAAFGEMNYLFDLGDKGEIEMTGGIRYYQLSREDNDQYDGFFFTGINKIKSAQEKGTRKKFSISWRPHEDFSVYSLYAEGYRPGGTNVPLALACQNDPASENWALDYDSDQIKSYEIGAKGAVFDKKVHFSTAVYQIDWTGVQVPVRIPSGCGYTANGATARSRGIEFESTSYLTDALTLSLNFSYTDSKFTQDVPALDVTAGENMTMVPKYNLFAALQYEYNIFGKEAFARANVSGYGDYKSNFKDRTEDISDAYMIVDVSTTIRANDNVNFSFHVKNFLNKEYTTYKQSGGFYPDGDYRIAFFGNERTFIVRTDFSF